MSDILDFGEDWTPDDGGPRTGSYTLNGQLVQWRRDGDALHYRITGHELHIY